jgi:hypothetical protein
MTAPNLQIVRRSDIAGDITLLDPAILAGQLAASSIATYRRDFAAYVAFAGDGTAAREPITLARWRAHLAVHSTKSPHTINRMLAARTQR